MRMIEERKTAPIELHYCSGKEREERRGGMRREEERRGGKRREEEG